MTGKKEILSFKFPVKNPLKVFFYKTKSNFETFLRVVLGLPWSTSVLNVVVLSLFATARDRTQTDRGADLQILFFINIDR